MIVYSVIICTCKIVFCKLYKFHIICVCVLDTQSCLTLVDPMDGSLPGSSVHGILQAGGTGVGCHFLLHHIIYA